MRWIQVEINKTKKKGAWSGTITYKQLKDT